MEDGRIHPNLTKPGRSALADFDGLQLSAATPPQDVGAGDGREQAQDRVKRGHFRHRGQRHGELDAVVEEVAVGIETEGKVAFVAILRGQGSGAARR